MKIRLADYVANFLVDHGVTDVFSVVGGGAMHLNDALGHKEGLHVTYNHHEQACAIAAEAYARLDNKIAAVQNLQPVYVTNYTYLDGDEIASRTVTKVDRSMVKDKKKRR